MEKWAKALKAQGILHKANKISQRCENFQVERAGRSERAVTIKLHEIFTCETRTSETVPVCGKGDGADLKRYCVTYGLIYKILCHQYNYVSHSHRGHSLKTIAAYGR